MLRRGHDGKLNGYVLPGSLYPLGQQSQHEFSWGDATVATDMAKECDGCVGWLDVSPLRPGNDAMLCNMIAVEESVVVMLKLEFIHGGQRLTVNTRNEKVPALLEHLRLDAMSYLVVTPKSERCPALEKSRCTSTPP